MFYSVIPEQAGIQNVLAEFRFYGLIETGGSFKPDGQSFQWVRGGGKSVSVEAGTTHLWSPLRKGGYRRRSMAGILRLAGTLPVSHVLLSYVSPHPYFPALQD